MDFVTFDQPPKVDEVEQASLEKSEEDLDNKEAFGDFDEKKIE